MTATPKANAIPKIPMPSCGIEALRIDTERHVFTAA